MGLDTEKNPILYSVGTYLAYIISRRYYGHFDRRKKEI